MVLNLCTLAFLLLLRPYPPLAKLFLLSFKACDIKDPDERARDFKKQWERDNWTTEHYAEKGRKTIARRVAEELKTW